MACGDVFIIMRPAWRRSVHNSVGLRTKVHARNSCHRNSWTEAQAEAGRRLAFVYDDLSTPQHHFGIQHRIDVLQRIALKQDDVGHLPRLD